MNHSFDVEIATKIGINEAILLNNIKYRIDKNKANDKHFYEGIHWTYYSEREFNELFPYMCDRNIKRALKNLVENGYLITGNFNLPLHDRKIWYALTYTGNGLFEHPTCAR